MDTFAVVTRAVDTRPFSPGRSCFIDFPTIESAKLAIADLLLADLTFTVRALHEPDEMCEDQDEDPKSRLPHLWSVQFGLDLPGHFVLAEQYEAAFIAYAESFGGTYSGS